MAENSDRSAEGGMIRGSEFRYREKESYAIIIMEGFINLNRTAGRVGMGPDYEDALDDLLATIPTYEFTNEAYQPHPSLIDLIGFYREYIGKIGVADADPIPNGKSGTYLELLKWSEKMHPSDWKISDTIRRTDSRFRFMDRIRITIKKRILMDLAEDMGLLRHRTFQSQQSANELDELEAEAQQAYE